MDKKWEKRKQRVFEIIEIGTHYDYASRAYDFFNALSILVNLTVSILYTFNDIEAKYGTLLLDIEAFTVATFLIDYLLRIWTSQCLHPELTPLQALRKYVFSFMGIVDLLSFLPYYLPIFFPSGAVAFRMLRIVRIFRIFRINAYYDSLNVITEVIVGKKQQLFSSVFIILVLMVASSLCMYSLENRAQPEVFSNAFSGIWWAASTLLTVGYGDIYPITTLGKMFGIFITFLGVGMVAIPTGIISAGFVDQYSRIKRMSEYGNESDVHFIRIQLTENDKWVGKTIAQIDLPERVTIAVISRKHRILVPRGSLVLRQDDVLVLGAESFRDKEHIKLKEVVLLKNNPWVGERIRELNISRQTVIVMIKRNGKVMIPNGNMILYEHDVVFLYTQSHIPSADEIEL
nr:ion transporter [uncultured Mediterraneibacter sp.]